jgi:hypothetical protein
MLTTDIDSNAEWYFIKAKQKSCVASPMKTIATGKGDYLRPSVTDENQLNSDIDAKYLLISFLTSSLQPYNIKYFTHVTTAQINKPPKLQNRNHVFYFRSPPN